MGKRFIAAGALVVTLGLFVQARAEEATTQLKEVVVTATRTEKDPADVAQTVSVVSAEEIRRSGATDVATAIQNATGVHISGYGTPGSVESLKMRGAYSSQVLVLLDGMRMNSARDGGFDLSLIPVAVEDIERIEIVRGPASALYGSDAVGGVINIITRKPAGRQSRFKAIAGSHGYDELFLSDAVRRGGGYSSVSIDRETSRGYRENSDLYQWVYNAKAGYDLSKTSNLELSLNYLTNDKGSPGAAETPQNPRKMAYLTPFARQQERNAVVGAAYTGKIVPAVTVKVSGYRKQDDLTYFDLAAIDFVTGMPSVNRYETTSDGGEAQVSWLMSRWNQVTVGSELRKDYLHTFDPANGDSRHSASVKAYYLQDELSIGEQFLIVLGGRYDDYSTFETRFSPKASARLTIAATGTILRASYGKSFRAPTFNDLYFNTAWAVGNPALRPESAKEYEAGIEQKFGKDLTMKVIGFDRKVRDLIEWDWSIFPMTVFNIGRARIRGSEYEASYRVGNGALVAVNYTYTNPVNELTGEKIYNTIPQKQAKAVVSVFPAKGTTLSVEGRSVENYVRQDKPTWRYSVMDARVAQKIGVGNEVFFAMNNVFDRKYEAVPGFPMPPKEIRGGVTLQF